MQLANQEAQRFNHEYIGTEHILLGLVKEGVGVAANLLKSLDVDLRRIRLEVERIVQSGPDMVMLGRLPQTPHAKKVIEYTLEEARNLNHNYVGTEHLLLGLLHVTEGVAAQVLLNLGLRPEVVREETLNLLGHNLERDRPRASAAAEWPDPLSPPDERPAHLSQWDDEINRLDAAKKEAVEEQDFDTAAHLRDQADRLKKKKAKATRDWLEDWRQQATLEALPELRELDAEIERLDAAGEAEAARQLGARRHQLVQRWRRDIICAALPQVGEADEEEQRLLPEHADAVARKDGDRARVLGDRIKALQRHKQELLKRWKGTPPGLVWTGPFAGAVARAHVVRTQPEAGRGKEEGGDEKNAAPEAPGARDALDNILTRTVDRQVARAMERLRGRVTSRDWEVFQRTMIQGQTTLQVAADLALSLATVSRIKSRIMALLRQVLRPEEEV
jgi:ATP-dependent Clp protease ATP-binding subunit ClpA